MHPNTITLSTYMYNIYVWSTASLDSFSNFLCIYNSMQLILWLLCLSLLKERKTFKWGRCRVRCCTKSSLHRTRPTPNLVPRPSPPPAFAYCKQMRLANTKSFVCVHSTRMLCALPLHRRASVACCQQTMPAQSLTPGASKSWGNSTPMWMVCVVP